MKAVGVTLMTVAVLGFCIGATHRKDYISEETASAVRAAMAKEAEERRRNEVTFEDNGRKRRYVLADVGRYRAKVGLGSDGGVVPLSTVRDDVIKELVRDGIVVVADPAGPLGKNIVAQRTPYMVATGEWKLGMIALAVCGAFCVAWGAQRHRDEKKSRDDAAFRKAVSDFDKIE